MAKVKLALAEKTDDDVIALTSTIVTSMTGNANFTTPNPPLATLTTSKTALQTKINAYNAALASADTLKADRDAASIALRNLLTQEGAYVDNITGGDKIKIESSGMDTRSESAPIPMTRVLELELSEGDHSGTIQIFWKPIRGAKSYEIQINLVNPDTEASWAFKQVATASSDTLESLTPGQRIWARVRAIGGAGDKGAWSDPATRFVP